MIFITMVQTSALTFYMATLNNYDLDDLVRLGDPYFFDRMGFQAIRWQQVFND